MRITLNRPVSDYSQTLAELQRSRTRLALLRFDTTAIDRALLLLTETRDAVNREAMAIVLDNMPDEPLRMH